MRQLKQRVTIQDVAQRAGVSPATVSNLLNGKGRLGPETGTRIRTAMEELHFTPSGLIRALHNRRANVLGLLVGGIRFLANEAHPVTTPILAGVYEVADQARQDVLLYTGWPERSERASGSDFLDGRADGLIWVAPPVGSPALEKLSQACFPVVAVLGRRVPDNIGFVDSDNVGGGYQVVEHLIAKGHRRIGFAGPIHSSNFMDRFQGYCNALEANGIECDPTLAATGPELRAYPGGPEVYAPVLDAWLALPDPPTAAFVCTDHWAANLASAALARGLHIPEDLALAGFDDTPDERSLCGGLTTVGQPFSEIGRAAVTQLLKMIEGAPAAECRVSVPLTLIARASTEKTL